MLASGLRNGSVWKVYEKSPNLEVPSFGFLYWFLVIVGMVSRVLEVMSDMGFFFFFAGVLLSWLWLVFQCLNFSQKRW